MLKIVVTSILLSSLIGNKRKKASRFYHAAVAGEKKYCPFGRYEVAGLARTVAMASFALFLGVGNERTSRHKSFCYFFPIVSCFFPGNHYAVDIDSLHPYSKLSGESF